MASPQPNRARRIDLVVDDAGHITGLFDFEESCEADRHHEFRWMPSYGPALLARALAVYGERTGARVDLGCVRRAHALSALAQLGWGLRQPADHVRTGRTVDQTKAWGSRRWTRRAERRTQHR